MLGLKTAQPGHFGGVGCELTPPIKKSRAPIAKPIANKRRRFLTRYLPNVSLGYNTDNNPSGVTRVNRTDLRTTRRQPDNARSVRYRWFGGGASIEHLDGVAGVGRRPTVLTKARPLRYQQLFALNRAISQIDGFTLVDPNLIYPGMKLLFPADATGIPPPAP